MLPIIHVGLESHTHSVVDKSLGCLPMVLAVLDFTSIKNELFPTVAAVFSKTSSLGIKVRGLEAFMVLCGGSKDQENDDTDGFNGFANTGTHPKTQTSAVLDKYTIQEKIVPLLKAVKTKEPAVVMAALAVFKQVGQIADAEFLALETLPILWSFSLGPLLNLQQFQQYMDLIRKISSRIESEQVKKLRDLSSNASHSAEGSRSNDLMNVASSNAATQNGAGDVGEGDFARLVLGSRASNGTDMLGDAQSQSTSFAASSPDPPVFSWSSPRPSAPSINAQSRTVTPDQSLHAFATLSPTTATGAQSNMQRTTANGLNSFAAMQPFKPSPWPSAATQQPFAQPPTAVSGFASAPVPPTNTFPSFSLAPPPPASPQQQYNVNGTTAAPSAFGQNMARPTVPPPKKSGLDAYESLL